MTEPSRASRRTLLLGTAASVVGCACALATRRPAAVGLAAASPLPIEQAAVVGAPARRLGVAVEEGRIMFPMGPAPRCDILDNFGEPRGRRRHEGVDILATLGQEVYAVDDGVLVNQADASAALSGNAWGLTAGDGTYYFYAHLSAFADGLELGDRVNRGDVIGYVGDTGNPGPGNYHLHFEVRPGGLRGSAVDPLPLLTIPSACRIT